MSTTQFKSRIAEALATGFRVTKLQEYKGLSQETMAFSAILTKDGKPYAEITNDGHGGADMVNPLPGKAPAGGWADFMTPINEAAAKVRGDDFMAFESFIGDLVEHAVVVAEMNRKRNLCYRLPADGDFWETGAYRYVPSKYNQAQAREAIKRDLPGAMFWDKKAGDFVAA